MKTAYVGGSFVYLHSGHVNFLRQCAEIADRVVVSLNTDEFITSYKGVSPILSYDERRKVLEGCRYVDEVIPNVGGSDSKPAILRAKPDFIIVGSDWVAKDYYKQMQFTQEWLDEQGIILIFVPYSLGISTTEIKRRLNESISSIL